MSLKWWQLAWWLPTRWRVDNDYYATDPKCVLDLLRVEEFCGTMLEPCCWEWHISKVLEDKWYNVASFDLIDRWYWTGWVDFLKDSFWVVDNIITNPPFSLFKEFLERSLWIAEYKVCFFGKIQALEWQKRASYLEYTPLKYVYVYKKRQRVLRNWKEIDPNTGKKMASSTMAFCWYVWEIWYTGSPMIKWI